MKKLLWLLLLLTAWVVAGYVVFGSQQARKRVSAGQMSHASRIVSMAPDLTEILFALGLEKEIVGVTVDSDYPPAAKAKAKVGTFWQPNIEAVIAAKPDLVITLGFEQQKELAARLKRMGYDCLTLNIEKISDFFDAVRTIAVVTGKQDQAEKLTAGIKNKIADLVATADPDKKIRVLWVVQREPLRVAGKDTFINEVIELAGGENAIGPTLHKYPPIGAEQVIACGAQVIIEPTMMRQNSAGQLRQARQYWSKYRNVPAVINNRIYIIDGDTVSRLGPRLADGIETVAGCLRSDLFVH